MLRPLLLAAWLLALPCAADEFIDFSAIKPGQQGHGLSVFSGTVPVRFDVKAIAVLANSLPGQDLLLVRCAGQDLEKTGIIAGMSGSPIYFDGKLAGALAYAWTFGKEPIAGVTPIRAMLEELKRKPSVPRSPPGLERLASPLLVSGFTPALMKALERRLGKLGLMPVMGAGSRPAGDQQPAVPVPGGAIGVELMRGDYNASAVGTITHVDGDRVLAFGHPLFGLGAMALPATGANVHVVFSSSYLSFKFASPLGSLGSLVEDRQSCIVVRKGAQPKMVPVRLRVRNSLTTREQRFAIEVVDHAKLTASMVLDAAANALDAAEASGDDLTADVRITARLRDGRELAIADRFHNGRGGPFNLESFAPFLELPDNVFEPALLSSVDAELELTPGRATAEILDAYPSVREARAGERFEVHVLVKPYGQPPRKLSVALEMPAEVAGDTLELDIDGGSGLKPDAASPEDLEGLLRRARARFRASDLVVSLDDGGRALDRRGFYIDRVPGSVGAVLGHETRPARSRVKTPTEWVLSGYASTSVGLKRQVVAR